MKIWFKKWLNWKIVRGGSGKCIYKKIIVVSHPLKIIMNSYLPSQQQREITIKSLHCTHFVNTGNVEPIIWSRAKSSARVDRQRTIRRRDASTGHQFVASDGAFPLATLCTKCFMSFMWSCMHEMEIKIQKIRVDSILYIPLRGIEREIERAWKNVCIRTFCATKIS